MDKKPIEPKLRRLGVYLVALSLSLFVLILLTWPEPNKADPKEPGITANESQTNGLTISFVDKLSPEIRLFLVAALSGALGSTVILLVTFVDFATSNKFQNEMLWWYYLRPVTGFIVAFVVYIAIRGGILKVESDVSFLNPYTISGVSAVAGIWSRQIVDKLRSYADSNFRTEAIPSYETVNSVNRKMTKDRPDIDESEPVVKK